MKTLSLYLAVLFVAVASHAQPAPPRPLPPQAEAVKELVNYVIRVEWKEPKGEPKFLEVLTTEGQFNLNTIQKNSVKINNNEVPTTLKFSGSLAAINGDKGRLQLFLGRSVPYVTGSHGTGPEMTSTYSQMSVGLDSTVMVKFGESQMVQSDENGQISVLVKRADK